MNLDFYPSRNGARRRVVTLIILAVALGILLVYHLTGYFQEIRTIADDHPEQAFVKLKSFSSAFLLINGIITSLFAAYFTFTAWKIWKNGRFPPAGMKVIRSTKVHTGSRAKIIAVVCLLIALLMLSTNIFLWYFNEMTKKFDQKKGNGSIEFVAAEGFSVGLSAIQSLPEIQNGWR
ncbi:MAG: hypothetical protein WCA08_11150 [Desulfoferrobacter sp.]